MKGSVIDRVNKIRMEITNLRTELGRKEHELVDEVMNFQGSVGDALALGLVKLGVKQPVGFSRYLSMRRKEILNNAERD